MDTRPAFLVRSVPAILFGPWLAAASLAESPTACSLAAHPQFLQVDHAVDAQMEKWHSPGAALAVVERGTVVLARGYGLADRDRSLPVTIDTPFHLGSVAKIFTATAVLMLAEGGRIDLDRSAGDYLSGLPVAYRGVSVRHLLTHTSGIPRDIAGAGGSLVDAGLYAALAITKPQFTAGQRLGYSNTDYILLGMLIEAVSGLGYGDFLAARIFRPLGMTRTRYAGPGQPIAGLAIGYEWLNGQFEAVDAVPARYGAGAVVSTVSDLARWDAALDTDRLLPQSTLARMWQGSKLQNGRPAILGSDDAGRLLESGMGWFDSRHFGHRVVHHGGNLDGYSAQLDRFIDDRLSVIVLANNEAHAAINIAQAVERICVPNLDLTSALSLAQLGRIAFDEERVADALQLLTAALAKGDTTPGTAYTAARCHARLGQASSALAALELAARLGYDNAARLASDPTLAALRADPRWAAIANRVSANDR